LNFQEPIYFIILLHRWHFDSNLDLSSFFGSDFESNFLKVFVSLIATDREDVFVKVVKLLVGALGDDSQEEGVIGWSFE
jgi:hypothetical protein